MAGASSFVSAADKATRARAIQARLAMGRVHFPRRAPWTPALVAELLRFPSGRHDDQVDVMALFGCMLAAYARGVAPAPAASAPLPSTR